MSAEASTPLYLTRLITNICAPTFVFLARVSAGLMAERKSKAELSRFLLMRGMWLILLEVTIVNFGWKFEFSGFPGHFMLQVIWAIGVSMIALAGFIHLPRAAVWGTGLGIVCAHNVLDALLPEAGFPFNTSPLWLNVHRSIIWEAGGYKFFILYPVLAWAGVMACGFGLAQVFRWEAVKRIQFFSRLGSVLVLLFFVIRGLNLYGDPQPWQMNENINLVVRDFFNVSKYPPSLLFLCFNLGFVLFILAAVERWKPPLNSMMITIGRVPLFYYVGHIYLAHALAVLVGTLQGFKATDMMVMFIGFPEGYGFGMPGVY